MGSGVYSNPTAEGLLTDLVAFWDMEQFSGKTRRDKVGTNHLTDNNKVPRVAGKVQAGALFQVTHGHSLSLNDSTPLVMGDIDFTIYGWLCPSSVPAFNDYWPLVSKWTYDQTNREYEVWVQPISGNIRLRFGVRNVANTSTTFHTNTSFILQPGLWTQFAAWHNSSDNTINTQVNNGTTISTAHATGVRSSDAPFLLGAESTDSPADARLDGALDAIGIWKRLLTATELTYLYNNGMGREYPFI